jgi:hypothetical protein
MSWGYAFYDETGALIHSTDTDEIRVLAYDRIRLTRTRRDYLINLRSYHPAADMLLPLGCTLKYTVGNHTWMDRTPFVRLSCPMAGTFPIRITLSGGYAALKALFISDARDETYYDSANVLSMNNEFDFRHPKSGERWNAYGSYIDDYDFDFLVARRV